MKLILSLFILFLSTSLVAQDDLPPDLNEFIADHVRNADVATKMLVYDCVAWVSSDSVQTLTEGELKTYGGQWFCYLDSIGQYHALYGAYDSIYTLTAHYVVDSTTFSGNRTFKPFDTTLANTFARAYNLAIERKREFLGPEDNLRYNHFIFRADSTLTVHFLPGYQSSGYIFYGSEMHYALDASATMIMDTVELFDKYRNYQPNARQKISLGFEEYDRTTIGGIFFLMSYERYFKSICLYTKNYLTTYIRGKDGKVRWIHAVRQEPQTKKKKKKRNF